MNSMKKKTIIAKKIKLLNKFIMPERGYNQNNFLEREESSHENNIYL